MHINVVKVRTEKQQKKYSAKKYVLFSCFAKTQKTPILCHGNIGLEYFFVFSMKKRKKQHYTQLSYLAYI
jgi:hypothetical protein